ncbi:MAG: hypothetical protein H7123_07755 [Thermoleophilia bacterium]|nr:hypothetical protein [Thermoleophilia bacterium]
MPDASDVLRGAAGAVVAAVVAGVAWGAIVWQTNYEIGFAAIGVGFLVGKAMAIVTGNKRGRQLQVIAVLASVLGILVGKYMTVYFVLRDQGADIKLVDSRLMQFIKENPGSVFSLIDIVFFVIAVLYAARQLEPTTSKFQRDSS